MIAALDIPDPALVEIRSIFEREGAPGDGVPVQMFVRWIDGGNPEFHFGPFMPKREASALGSPKEPRFFAFAERYVRDKPGMAHDMASIRESIAHGRKAEWDSKDGL